MPSGRPTPIYLDYNATAPLLPEALQAVQRGLTEFPGNPSSPHLYGQSARDALETARASLAARLGFSRREVLFTAGGTESNNAALRWLAGLPKPVHLVTTPIEHPSVLRSAEWLAECGVAVDYLPVGSDGIVRADALPDLLRPETRVVSVMAANNETGILQPLERIGATVKRARASGIAPRVLFHSDAVQAFGRVPLPLAEWGVDAVTVAAHKLGGPKGIGALALREHSGIPPFLLGGKQERGRRAGTESVFLAMGFAAAADWVFTRGDLAARLAALRDRLEVRLRDVPGFLVNGADAARVPNTSNLGFAGIAAQSLLVALDLEGIAVSTGSACSSGSLEPSHVLSAMGLPEERIRGALRISVGWGTTESDIDRCAEVLRAHVLRLARSGDLLPRAAVAS